MSVVVTREGARLMYQVLRGVQADGALDERLLDAALGTPGYRFYFRFHQQLPEPFGPDEFKEMIGSLSPPAQDRPSTPSNRRLAGIRSRFLDGMGRLAEIGKCLDLIDGLPQEHWDRMEQSALGVLPAGTVIDTQVHYIMDGFNNGTAFDGEVAFDLLQTTPSSILDFEPGIGAHELHHIGYARAKAGDHWRVEVEGDPTSPLGCALSLADVVLSEGMAQYYFTGETFADYLREVVPPDQAEATGQAYVDMLARRAEKASELFGCLETLLAEEGHITPERGRTIRRAWGNSEPGNPLPWAHVVGALIVGVIEQYVGRQQLIALVLRPELFPSVYFRALEAARGKPGGTAAPLVDDLPRPSPRLLALLAAVRT